MSVQAPTPQQPSALEADSAPGSRRRSCSIQPPSLGSAATTPPPCLGYRCPQTCVCVCVTLMRLEVCCCSSRAANGPAGCENLFQCLSSFSPPAGCCFPPALADTRLHSRLPEARFCRLRRCGSCGAATLDKTSSRRPGFISLFP